jgi:hypothetical protein
MTVETLTCGILFKPVYLERRYSISLSQPAASVVVLVLVSRVTIGIPLVSLIACLATGHVPLTSGGTTRHSPGQGN